MQAEAVTCFKSIVYGHSDGRVTPLIAYHLRLCRGRLSSLEKDSFTGLEEASCHVVRGIKESHMTRDYWGL